MIQGMHREVGYNSAGHGDGYDSRKSDPLRRKVDPIVQAVLEDGMQLLRRQATSCLTKRDYSSKNNSPCLVKKKHCSLPLHFDGSTTTYEMQA